MNLIYVCSPTARGHWDALHQRSDLVTVLTFEAAEMEITGSSYRRQAFLLLCVFLGTPCIKDRPKAGSRILVGTIGSCAWDHTLVSKSWP